MVSLLRIELLGWLRVVQQNRIITRFGTYKNGALLAYLAYYNHRSHMREALVEQFWPDAKQGRDNLNQAVATLRRLIEPPNVATGAILQADRQCIRLNPQAIIIDTTVFGEAHQAGLKSTADEQIGRLTTAVDLYNGDLLPGCEGEWIVAEREQLSGSYLECLHLLTRRWAEKRDLDRALDYARRALELEPNSEKAHRDLMRLYLAAGRPAAAYQQYEVLERELKDAFDVAPSKASRDLAVQIGRSAHNPKVAARAASGREVARAPLESSSQPGVTEFRDSAVRLPLQFTRFFGRESELSKLTEWLQPSCPCSFESVQAQSDERSHVVPTHLVTLTGAGGTGKTRLAIETARRLSTPYNHAVCFVSLGDVLDAHRLLDAVVSSLKRGHTDGGDPVEQIAEVVSGRPYLMVLDNFEQLVPKGAAVIQSLRYRVPTLSLFVTSRRLLGLPGEREFPLMPLPLPEPDHCAQELIDCSSVRLFLDRAQSARPDFQVTQRNAPTVAALCRRLEGIPLALELAASWAMTLAPAQMLSWLDRPSSLRGSRSSTPQSRHISLSATIDWSYQLLPHDLRSLFARLSVFRGGWTLDSAQRVCRSHGTPPTGGTDDRTLDALNVLRSHSLISTEETESGMRFRMLEVMREYAQELLPPNERFELASSHADYLIEYSGEIQRGSLADPPLPKTALEIENYRTALQWCINNIDSERALLLAQYYLLWHPWIPVTEGLTWLEEALKMTLGVVSLPRAQTAEAAGVLAAKQGKKEAARAWYDESLRQFSLLERQDCSASLLLRMGHIADDMNSGLAYYRSAASIFKALELHGAYAWALTCEAGITRDLNTALDLLNESRCIMRREGGNSGWLLFQLSWTLLDMNDLDRAEAHVAEGMVCFQQAGSRFGVARMQVAKARLAAARCDYTAADIGFREALTAFRARGDKAAVASTLAYLGNLHESVGNRVEAIRLHRESLHLSGQLDDANHCASQLSTLARFMTDGGHKKASIVMRGAASAYRQSYYGEPDEPAVEIEMARTSVGDAVYSSLWEKGGAMSLPHAITYALDATRCLITK